MRAEPSAGDAIATDASVIELRVAELRQLFDAMDPAPFRERALDRRVEEYIVSWGEELPRDARLALLVHLERPAGLPDEGRVLGEAIHQFFNEEGTSARRRLKQLFHRGRISLLIGLSFLGAALGTSHLLAQSANPSGMFQVIEASLVIGGWVAMWRPIEVFLYDWWPIRAQARLFDRLARMPVQIRYSTDQSSDAWRRDWPAASTPAAASREREVGAGPGVA